MWTGEVTAEPLAHRAAEPVLAPRHIKGRSGWESRAGVKGLEDAHAAWNALAHRGEGHLADAEWLTSFLEAFVPDEQRADVSIHLLWQQGRLAAAVPLQRAGRGVRVWRSLANTQSPYFSAALDPRAVPELKPLLEKLLADRELLLLDRVYREGPLARGVLRAAGALGLPVVEEPDGGEALIDLGRPWSQVAAGLPKHVLKSAPRKKRRLGEKGELRYSVVTGGPRLEGLLEECFRLEARGWKGSYGSPIIARPETHRFYRSLASRTAAADRFALYLLSLDSRVIAFEYCLRSPERIEQLKIGYDPDHYPHSPGQLLRIMLLEDEHRRGFRGRFHMGLLGGWKHEWATEVLPLSRLQVFARTGRALAYYHAGPKLRLTLKTTMKAHPAVARAVKHLLGAARRWRARWTGRGPEARPPGRVVTER